MGSFFQRKPVRCFLAVFKWCRVSVLLLVLLAVAALTYLQLIGLPDYLKNPLLRALQQRGFDAHFASARLAWGPSIVIENAAFSPTNEAGGPRLSAEWTQLDLNTAALLRARLHVDAFEVLKANVDLPVSPTNQEPLRLTDANLRVVLLSNHVARVTSGNAWFHGIRIQMNGEIRDFQSMRGWKVRLAATPAVPAPAAKPGSQLTFWEIFQQMRFTGAPQLKLHFYADGVDQNTLRAEAEFTAGGTRSPWGQCGALFVQAACARLFNSGPSPFFQARCLVRDVSTPWAAAGNLSATVDFSREAKTNVLAEFHLDSHGFKGAWNSSSTSNWARAADLEWDGAGRFFPAEFKPESVSGTIHAGQIESSWGSIGSASLVLRGARTDVSNSPDPALGPWNLLQPFKLDWQVSATNILTPKLKSDRVVFDADWQTPRLTVHKLEAAMYQGHLDVNGVLDAATREVQTRVAIDFDPPQISSLLSEPVRHWISLCKLESRPKLAVSFRVVLPPWTNRMDAWPENSRRSLQLAGDIALGKAAFQGLAINSAQSHFNYTNGVWNVPGLQVATDSGSLDLDYTWSELAGAYHFRFDSKLNPAIAFPLLTPAQKLAMGEFSFRDKPEIKGEAWGNWRDAESTGFTVALTAGRFKVLGETVNQLNAKLDFTNRFLRVTELSLSHDTGRAEMPLGGIRFASNSMVISMTNATSTMDPEPVRRALGRNAPPFMKEVHFDSPPLVQASGSFVPGDDFGTDMHFFVKGDHFRWNSVTADSIQGTVDYHIRTVIATNVQASIYKTGKARGWFDIEWEKRGTRFGSDFNFTDLDLSSLAKGFADKNTKLEGVLDGQLALAAPYDASQTNLYGHGWLHLHNGLLWDIKIFGAFSPVLNAIAPGSGDSRAREASADFVITNGVLSTDDLEIRSSGFRLFYRGTIDTQRRLNARVEANLLRDTPVFGHFLSWMLTPVDKIFEYRVTGTLNKPVTKPIYIPKVFLALLRPFHSLKELLPPLPPKTNSESKPPPGQTPAQQPANPKKP